jgi:hypothetical protein
MRCAAAGTPRQGGDSSAWRPFAGASPGRGSRRPKRARVSATRRGEAREHAKGVRGKLGRPRRPALEGGGSTSPASSRGRCCVQENGEEAGGFCLPRKGASKMLTDEDGAVAAMFSDDGGSGGAPTLQGHSSYGCRGREPAASKAQQASDAALERKKGREG